MSGASFIWCGCRQTTRCLNHPQPLISSNVNLAQSSEVTQLRRKKKTYIHYIRVWIFDPFEWMGRLRVEVSSTAKVNPDVSCRWKPSYVTLNVSKAIGSTLPNFNMFMGGINHQILRVGYCYFTNIIAEVSWSCSIHMQHDGPSLGSLAQPTSCPAAEDLYTAGFTGQISEHLCGSMDWFRETLLYPMSLVLSMGISGSNWWRYVSTIFLAIFCGDIPWNSHWSYKSLGFAAAVPFNQFGDARLRETPRPPCKRKRWSRSHLKHLTYPLVN